MNQAQAQSLGYFEYNDRLSNLALKQDFILCCAQGMCVSDPLWKVFQLQKSRSPESLSVFIIHTQMHTLLFKHLGKWGPIHCFYNATGLSGVTQRMNTAKIQICPWTKLPVIFCAFVGRISPIAYKGFFFTTVHLALLSLLMKSS